MPLSEAFTPLPECWLFFACPPPPRQVLYNVVTCVTCVSLGGTLILPAVLRILHHARRPSRLRHQGWLDGFKGTVCAAAPWRGG